MKTSSNSFPAIDGDMESRVRSALRANGLPVIEEDIQFLARSVIHIEKKTSRLRSTVTRDERPYVSFISDKSPHEND